MAINYVEVSARVLDEHGNFVPNLEKEDFRIFEDKKAQAIHAFGLVQIPLERSERLHFMAAPIDSDVVANPRESGGRLYLLALDDLHSDPLRSQRVRSAVRKFIAEDLGAGDLAAVAVIGRSDATQGPTGNRRLLIQAVDKFTGQGLPSQTLEKIAAYNRQVDAGMIDPASDIGDPDILERLSNDRRTFKSLTRLVEWMGGIRGRRKALIYFGEGFGYDFRDVFRSLDSSLIVKPNLAEIFDNTREVISVATRGDVNIYAVDPRGLSAGGDDLIETASVADAGMPTNPSDTTIGNNSTTFRADLGTMSANRELEAARDNLRMLSEETGGFATLTSNDFTSAFKRIVDENSSYYVLGYYSTNERRDGKYREIDVRVPGRPGFVVRTRKGYLAPRGTPQSSTAVPVDSVPNLSKQLRDLLQSPVPVGGMTVSATAAAFKGSPPNDTVVVTVEAGAKDIGLAAKDGKFIANLAVALVVLDGDGKVRATVAPTLTLGLRPESYRQIAESGTIRIISQFALPPGRYQLRAALAAAPNNSGCVQYDLEVPDFTKTRLSLSSVALTSQKASLSPAVVDKHVDDRLPEPTTLREFSSDDELGLYLEAYDNQSHPVHKVNVVSTIRDTDGRMVFSNEQQRSNVELQNTRSLSTQIPLKGLGPGLYVLTVEARSEIGDQERVSQLLQFRIR